MLKISSFVAKTKQNQQITTFRKTAAHGKRLKVAFNVFVDDRDRFPLEVVEPKENVSLQHFRLVRALHVFFI